MYYASDNYATIEKKILTQLVRSGRTHYLVDTLEHIGGSFTLFNPANNKNDRSNYEYAEAFFRWLLSGDTSLSEKIKELNPMAKKFVDTTNLPEGFSSSYGQKIVRQLPVIFQELRRPDSRRAYINLLLEEDKVILGKETTHEYPCTIGVHFFIRADRLHMVVNMRSNNLWAVLPYDVYNFTMLQQHVAKMMSPAGYIGLGPYHHTMNSAHVFKRDLDKINAYL